VEIHTFHFPGHFGHGIHNQHCLLERIVPAFGKIKLKLEVVRYRSGHWSSPISANTARR
jgi:hypothetical protein